MRRAFALLVKHGKSSSHRDMDETLATGGGNFDAGK